MRQGKGDHVNIKMPSGAIITLPWSKELKIGLLTAAIKKADLTEDEFLELLYNEGKDGVYSCDPEGRRGGILG